MKGTNRFKKGDVILIIAMIVLIPLSFILFKTGGLSEKPSDDPNNSLMAVVTRDGKQVARIDLNKIEEPQYIRLEDGIKTTILAEKGSIKFLEADCPDKICIKTGTLTKPAERAVCLPGKTIVKIEDH